MSFKDLFGWGSPIGPPPKQSRILEIRNEDVKQMPMLPAPEEVDGTETDEEGVYSESDPIGHVNITLCANGDINLHFDWVEETDDMANCMAEMLFHLNNGNIKGSMIEVLVAYGHNNPDSSKFIHKILKTWDKLVGKGQPLIKPSEGLGHTMGNKE